VPTLSIFEKDSSRVVYVMKKQNYIPVRVQTGLSGNSYTIITDGLRGDEIIALSEPPNRLILPETGNKVSSDTVRTHKLE
jgi:hypothetical protein